MLRKKGDAVGGRGRDEETNLDMLDCLRTCAKRDLGLGLPPCYGWPRAKDSSAAHSLTYEAERRGEISGAEDFIEANFRFDQDQRLSYSSIEYQ